MFKKYACRFIVFTLLLVGVRPQALLAADLVWQDVFAARMESPSVTQHWNKYLKFDRSRCEDAANRLEDLAYQYGQAALKAQPSVALGIHKSIQELLSWAHEKERGCFEALATLYAADAVALSNATHLIPDRQNHLKDGIGVPFLVIALANNGALKFLTNETRALLGPGWQRINSNGELKVVGAYDCVKSQIYLDPRLPLFDFGASVLHELDHLFRDKDSLQGMRRFTYQGTTDWKSALLFDETAAIIYSSAVEYRISHPYKGSLRYTAMPGDFNLYSEQGPLSKIWKKNSPNAEGSFGYPRDSLIWSIASGDEFDRERAGLRYKPADVRAEVTVLYSLINQNYFPEENEIPWSHLAPERMSPDLDWFSKWVERVDVASYRCDLKPHMLEPYKVWKKANPHGDRSRFFDCYFRENEVLPFMWIATSKDISPNCNSYLGALPTSSLQKYEGRTLSRFRSGEAGVKGGEAGVKGEEQGIRPCLNLKEQL